MFPVPERKVIDTARIEGRKADHINITLSENVTPGYRYWDDIKLIHEALPELNYDDIDTSSVVLGKKLEFPFIVNAITGGFDGAVAINRNLAKACSEMGVGMGVGSQRAAAEGVSKESYSVINDYDIPLIIGNVGAPQLVEQKKKHALTSEDIGNLMDLISADYMAVHLNFLQEAVQPEGDMNGAGCTEAVRELAREFPLIVKETGAGISYKTAKRLESIGVKTIDIGGMGGTSFSAIEMYRAKEKNDVLKERIGKTFFDWGIPSTVSLLTINTKLPVIASGGILNGLDAAKSIAMGAVCAGASGAVLKAATESSDEVVRVLTVIREELRTAMMLTGCKNISQLSKTDYITVGKTAEWTEGF